MHRFAWLLFGLGALLLLTKGGAGFLLFPLFFFWPFALGAFLFGLFARRRGYGWHGPYGRGGPRPYYWRGRQGYYGGCGPRVDPGPEAYDDERRETPRANTGETTRL